MIHLRGIALSVRLAVTELRGLMKVITGFRQSLLVTTERPVNIRAGFLEKCGLGLFLFG
jgi:hypothetical protein